MLRLHRARNCVKLAEVPDQFYGAASWPEDIVFLRNAVGTVHLFQSRIQGR